MDEKRPWFIPMADYGVAYPHVNAEYKTATGLERTVAVTNELGRSVGALRAGRLGSEVTNADARPGIMAKTVHAHGVTILSVE